MAKRPSLAHGIEQAFEHQRGPLGIELPDDRHHQHAAPHLDNRRRHAADGAILFFDLMQPLRQPRRVRSRSVTLVETLIAPTIPGLVAQRREPVVPAGLPQILHVRRLFTAQGRLNPRQGIVGPGKRFHTIAGSASWFSDSPVLLTPPPTCKAIRPSV